MINDLVDISEELTIGVIEGLKNKGYEIGFCDRGHTVSKEGVNGCVMLSTVLEIMNDTQNDEELT